MQLDSASVEREPMYLHSFASTSIHFGNRSTTKRRSGLAGS